MASSCMHDHFDKLIIRTKEKNIYILTHKDNQLWSCTFCSLLPSSVTYIKNIIHFSYCNYRRLLMIGIKIVDVFHVKDKRFSLSNIMYSR